jgi:hypothetical protein
VALPFTLKGILRQKKNYENSIISLCENIIFKKSSLKKNQNPSRYYTTITNLKFQHKPKYHLSKKSSYKKELDLLLLLLPRGQNPLSYYYSIMNLNTIPLPLVGKARKKKKKKKNWPKVRNCVMSRNQGNLKCTTTHLLTSFSKKYEPVQKTA